MKGQSELRIVYKPGRGFYAVEGDEYERLMVDEVIGHVAAWCVSLSGWRGHRLRTREQQRDWWHPKDTMKGQV